MILTLVTLRSPPPPSSVTWILIGVTVAVAIVAIILYLLKSVTTEIRHSK